LTRCLIFSVGSVVAPTLPFVWSLQFQAPQALPTLSHPFCTRHLTSILGALGILLCVDGSWCVRLSLPQGHEYMLRSVAEVGRMAGKYERIEIHRKARCNYTQAHSRHSPIFLFAPPGTTDQLRLFEQTQCQNTSDTGIAPHMGRGSFSGGDVKS
jgi:hypothetical protein